MSKGFTLIELMIVIAIISILISIAIPLYQSYMISTRLKAAFQEISTQRPEYELEVNTQYSTSLPISAPIQETTICQILKSYDQQNGEINKAISCKLKNKTGLENGAEISLTRTQEGKYICHTVGIPTSHVPSYCLATE
ncbi:pilin [Acinetobacter ursingii]|uniref:pilin n=1 Tax=Acinetobacter ursingii TaxID=108980 RepID=UPI00125033EC|nr:prepilin-type N-terminal cleavage/methylation domain-containing protein [Acinetobacter ursingii]